MHVDGEARVRDLGIWLSFGGSSSNEASSGMHGLESQHFQTFAS